MSFDLDRIARLVAGRGPAIRVVVADVAGSAPREVGAAMLVWPDGQDGTIGGGELEYRAAATAREMLDTGREAAFQRLPLGPALGQCCGGAVSVLWEACDAGTCAELAGKDVIARPLPGQPAEPPLAVARMLASARGQGQVPRAQILQGWMIEPVAHPGQPLWIHGAGHVGRALVEVLAPLPDFAITWVDTGPGRFPDTIPQGVAVLPAPDPARAVALAPADAMHLILTYSHVIDLELCHAVLNHGFAHAGLIGSATKWARFRRRLAALGHGAGQIDRITCPIGDPGLGKHPQAIAVGVAAALLERKRKKTDRERTDDARNADFN